MENDIFVRNEATLLNYEKRLSGKKAYFRDISFKEFGVCNEHYLLLGCSENFEKIPSAEIFLKRL